MSDPSSTPTVANPVAPRPAVTLLIVRNAGAASEVLMGRRSAGHRFMPNSLVFPGGAVDEADYHGPIAAPFPAHAHNLLTRHAAPDYVHAMGVALARELEEESGLHLGHPPALDGVDYLCRAITPSIRPKRFDARFFVVAADRIGGKVVCSDELEEIRYFGLAELESVELEFATRASLGLLKDWLAMSADERRSRAAIPTMRERVWRDE
jgi:8-oxo-dGTP pyrophosphatase MutT (NUDIX family)